MSAEHEIRAVIESRRAAVAAKDAAASVRAYASDVAVFDFAPPLAQPPSDAIDPVRANRWFETWDGPLTVELRDVVVKVDADLACAFGLMRLSGRRADGSATDFWSRTTMCLERRGGEWRIVHEHNSVPMLMDGSGAAATDLQP